MVDDDSGGTEGYPGVEPARKGHFRANESNHRKQTRPVGVHHVHSFTGELQRRVVAGGQAPPAEHSRELTTQHLLIVFVLWNTMAASYSTGPPVPIKPIK
jgi:hypothetical protein